ncbi:unnamed protein product [Hermetia illucens]|uniref:Single domain-containing protein n=1 Tax=Hermetia illucens TaxID=343691 RepID=A0A7R8UTM6_HERIL|nr:uncharacterized protein LOC119655817 [Hermetia illucens]CAD7086763.1 unnamed protein product [Hermetia illucens]
MNAINLNFLLILVVGSAFAFDSYLPNARHPDVPDKCYLKVTGDFVEFGETLKPIGTERCAQYTCRDDFVFLVNQCSRYMVPENCEVLARDSSQAYPDCCPKLRCVDENGNVDIRNTSG